MEETCGTEQDPVPEEKLSLWEEDATEADVTMAHRSQCSESGDNPLDPNYLPPHYREEYRLAIDALIEEDLVGYYKFLEFADVVDFLAPSEIEYIQNSLQLPKQSAHPEHRYLDTSGDGSSDTYWPMHSDLDAPGLDLGWPQIHHFIGPTEVTTLVNPAAPDMPSIKEQARRLIKNAQMVIAVVMDVFTDVDIFLDILNAATRNVAVYLLLDEANVQYFINMVNNCRVNLEALQFLRVRTVTGISYHCRTGKSFKGQMLDRFILTDCRAVLSGNYSFMWSYEKLHRCMAHLFLGQLVSTFDEEFRILFAQSEPLNIKNMEDLTILPKHPYPGERPMLRGKYAPGQPEEWNKPPYEENLDWRMVKRQEPFQGPMDIYNRYPSPQSRLDPQTRLEPPFDQGPPRIMEGRGHKRHGFGEAGPGRYNFPYQPPGLPEAEPPGRPFYRGQQHRHPGLEPDYGGYGQTDAFWNQDFQQEEPYPEPGYPRETDPQNFDPVLNYLSSTRNVDIEQSSDKLIPGPDLPYATTHPRRHIGQPYACQTSPTPSNTTEKKFIPDHSSDRKDPTVKKGLRNWRINSYLSAYDSTGEPEGLPMGQGQIIDPFDDFPHPIQQPTPPPPQAVDTAISKIPNVREFKVPMLPRASQMPAYGKTTQRDLPKKFPDEIPQLMVVPEPKVPTPTPSESSSTTDGEKQEEIEPREPIASVLRRDDSFRGKHNAAVQRSSRLRSSLIFRSLDQSTPQDNSEQDEDKTKTETDQTKLSFGQRRSGAREPFEWRSYIKSSDNAKTEEDIGKQAEKGSESKLESLLESKAAAISTEAKTKESPEVAPKVDKVEAAPLPKTQIEQPKIEQPPLPPVQQPSASLLNESFLDMNDPNQRFLFFKELAAKRRAEKAAEEAILKQKSDSNKKKDESEEEKQVQKDVAGSSSETTKEDSQKNYGKTLGLSGKTEKVDSGVKEKLETKVATDSEKIELKQSQPSEPASNEKLTQENQTPQKMDAPKPIEKEDKQKEANKASIPSNDKQVTVENQPSTTTDATSKESQLKNNSSVPDFTKTLGLDLHSSLPSARIYERSQSQEAKKEATPKSRLWSPSIHKRELLKPFGVKQKNISSVQIEEATEEPTQAVASDATKDQDKVVKFETVDKTEIKTSTICEKAKEEESVEKSTTSATQVKEDTKDLSSTAKGKSELSPKESIKMAEFVKSTPVKEGTGHTHSLASEESGKQEKLLTILNPKQTQMSKKDESSVKSSNTEIKVCAEKPSPSQSELLSQDKPKIEQSPSGNEKSDAEQVEDSAQKSTGQECLNESQNTSEKVDSTKVASPKEVAKTIEKPDKLLSTSEKVTPAKSSEETIDKNVQVATSSSKDDTKEVDSGEKRASITAQEVEEEVASAESNFSKDVSVIEEKSSTTLSSDKTDPVTLSIDDSKPKYSVTYTEEVPQLESHSDTSSPASFATALEFISSEDSDILSPAKNDPQHLFKSGTLQSSVSDMSDFETPNSEMSMSPMPLTLDMDDTFEDNVSIAETVIETASRRKAATTEEVKGPIEGDADASKSKQIETQDFQSPETSDDSLDSATAQFEGKSQDQVGTMQLAKATEVKSSSATSEEKNETKMEDKPAEMINKDIVVSPAGTQESIDVKSLDPKVSTIKSEAETSSTNQTTTSPRTNDTKEAITGDNVSKISSKDSEVNEESTSESSKRATTVTKVYSRFQMAPSNASSETKSSTVTPTVPEVKTEDQTSEIKEQKSESITEETCLESMTEGVGPNFQESESETKPVESNVNIDLSNVENKASSATQKAKTIDESKTSEITTNKPSAAIENVVQEKGVAKTDVSSNASEVNQSPSCPITSKVTKEPETLDSTSKTTKDSCEPVQVANVDAHKDVSNETALKDEKIESKTGVGETNESTTSSATSEVTTDAKTSDKESKIVNKDISKSENEQKSKDTNDNTKENTESTKVIETAPSTAQPKQAKSRYLTSTANVISSSNLRDDTKILLEQISANSQTRNESSPAKEAPVTDDEKEDEADKNAKRKNDLRLSLGQQKSSQEKDKLLERFQTMRKDRKVYSRFEV